MSTDEPPWLEWNDIALWRGDRCLQRDLAGKLVPGAALTVRGPNGCGKTTLLRTLCGLSEPESGTVLCGGKPLPGARAWLYARLAYAGHQTGLKADLSTRENLRFAAGLAGTGTSPHDLLAALGLQRCADLPLRNLSAGQRRRAALARVLSSDKSIWVLDEPFSNLDHAGREWLSDYLNQHLVQGGALLLTAHQPTGLNPEHEVVLELAGIDP